jgi:hypothetical protein
MKARRSATAAPKQMNARISMKPVILLRAAAILMLVHFAGHTLGMMRGPSHGQEEIAVVGSMRAHHFDVIGSSRSYWDFFLGFGFDASLNMLLQSVLFWLLAGVARRDPATVRPFVALFVAAWAVSALICYRYFFVAPFVFALLLAAVLGAAWATTRRMS